MPIALVFFAGTLAALCLLGVQVLNQALQGMLSSIPLIGGALARTVSFDARIVGWLWDHIPGHTQGMQTIQVNHATEQGLNVAAHQANLNAINGILGVTIPNQRAVSNALYMPVRNAWTDWVTADAVAFQNFAASVGPQVRSLETSVDQTIPQQIAAVGPAVIRQVQGLGYVTAGDLAGTRAGIERDIGTAAAGAQAGAVRQLTPVIGQVQTDVGSLAGQIATSIVPGLTGVIALGQTLVGRITTVEECTAQICSSGSGNLLGDLGKALQAIDTVIDAGLLFALVAAAARDAQAVADEVVAVAQPFVSEGSSLFSSATGVAV